MDQFLNPKSMMTPGLAGGLMMLVANSICFVFPEMEFRYVALGLSLLIGFAAIAAIQTTLPARAAYWVVNSLIIFAMGVGTSNIGANIVASPHPGAPGPAHTAQADWALPFSLIGEARAQSRTDEGDPQTPRPSRQRGFFRRW